MQIKNKNKSTNNKTQKPQYIKSMKKPELFMCGICSWRMTLIGKIKDGKPLPTFSFFLCICLFYRFL